MAFSIEQTAGGWEWSCFQSAYGAASGVEPTLAQAKIELAIAEASIMESPFPPAVVKAMREDPVRFAADWADPPYTIASR